MPPDESIDVRIRLKESAKFNAETDYSASRVDNLGDQAAQAARKFRSLNRATSGTRVNLGLVSTRARGLTFMLGAALNLTEDLAGGILSVGEAAMFAGGGLGAGGVVGLTALAQGAGVAAFAMGGLGEALGGNEEALKRLTPEARELLDVLSSASEELRTTASSSMLPGVTKGGQAAMKNLPVFAKIIGDTGDSLGFLTQRAGELVGSRAWGEDLAKIGANNVTIIDNLGDGALHLAGALRHLLVGAGPIAIWLSEVANNGAQSAESFFKMKRETGELDKWLREARRDLRLLGSATGHAGRGILNLFGAQDVDGTKTLRNLDQILARFERWSKDPDTQRNFGKALTRELEEGAGDVAVAFVEGFVRAGPRAAEFFWNAFWDASAAGKLTLGAGVLWKSGVFKLLGRRLGRLGGGGAAGGLLGGGGRGSMKNPMYVIVMNDLPGGGIPGRGKPGRLPGELDKTPRWLRGAKTLGKGFFVLAPGIALGESGILPNNNFRTHGPGARLDPTDVAGARARGSQMQRVPDPVSPTRSTTVELPTRVQTRIKITAADVKLDGRKVGNAQLKHVIQERRRRG